MSCPDVCSPEELLHVGDFPTTFEFTIVDSITCDPSDIAAALVKEIIFKKPDGTVVVRTATFTTDGTDGKIEYTTVDANDLDQAGEWEIRAVVDTHQSSTCEERVYSKLVAT